MHPWVLLSYACLFATPIFALEARHAALQHDKRADVGMTERSFISKEALDQGQKGALERIKQNKAPSEEDAPRGNFRHHAKRDFLSDLKCGFSFGTKCGDEPKRESVFDGKNN